ncbi:MAG TPA: hypothetical protein VFP68_22540, partial [Burkholderiaceae bacterium]|nr:hypothetical protein [Burkholderiaceae bacterium]
MLGILAGTSFGHPWAWLVVQLCLTALVVLLTKTDVGAARAGAVTALFGAALFAAGDAGFILGIPVQLRAWA